MARLGELLVAAGRITEEQLDEGLRAQVLYGGRLGTNLVELFHLDLDAIALALARQKGVPAALGKHFERCDVTVQARLPPVLAERWAVVPIGRLANRRERIAVASSDVLTADVKDDLAQFLGCTAADVVPSIAGELRIRYYLERVYKIARPSRYLRVRRQTLAEIALPPPDELSGEHSQEVQLEAAIGAALEASIDAGSVEGTPTDPQPRLRAMNDAALEDGALTNEFERVSLDDTPDPPVIEIDPEISQVLVPEMRRHFVRTLGDADAGADTDAEVDVTEPAPLEREPPPERPPPREAPPPLMPKAAEGTLARIAIRRISQALPREGAALDLGKLDDAARAIRRAGSRDKVGDLIVRAALMIGRDAVDAIVLFGVREPIAVGWKGEVRSATPALDRIAVPLDQPNAVARAFQRPGLERLDCAADATSLDLRLWTALGGAAPAQVVVAPVVIGSHPVCLLYAHGSGVDTVEDMLCQLAEAAQTAFVRLLRQTLR